jgi:deoxycytidylate deaminase
MASQKIGAILVFKKSVLAVGFNKSKSHPTQLLYNKHRELHKQQRSFLHAEIDCLSQIKNKIPEGSTLFIARDDLNGKSAMCRPCEGCMEYIKSRHIKEIVYNTKDGYAVELL